MFEPARRLLSLYDKLQNKGHEIPKSFGCAKSDLDIFKKHYDQPLPDELIAFLSLTLPKDSLDIGVFKTSNPKGLLDEQLGALPFEGNIKNGFFGLGWWTGKTDGDAWLYDLTTKKIYAVQLYDNDLGSKEEVISKAYHRFDSFDAWIDFLEQECKNRGWLK